MSVFALLATTATAQQLEECGTVEVNNELKKAYPEIAQYEEQFREFMANGVGQMNLGRGQAKGTFGPNDTLHVPVVVHVIHDFDNGGSEYVSDNEIYEMMDSVNAVYMSRNGDTVSVIQPFKKYIGRPNIQFHLATKDPLGRSTIGITRRQSYLTDGGDDQAKFDQWDPSSYLNIWITRVIGRGSGSGTVLAYAVFPTSAGAFPYNDGIISASPYIADDGKTIAHEIGHILGLFHTWGNVQGDAGDCTGDDEVDDTPPTDGHNTSVCPLYDTTCILNQASLSKIQIDPTLNPGVNNNNNVGFDYKALTNLTIQTVTIYPTAVGQEFEIANKLGSNVIDVLTTKDSAIAKNAIGTTDTATFYGGSGAINEVIFDVSKAMWLDSFTVYPAPSAAGSPFTVMLIDVNNDTIKTYTANASASASQNVPFSAFMRRGTNYKLVLTQNPGLMCDTAVSASNFKTNIVGAINIKDIVDANNNNKYKFFYDWSVRYDALTTSDTSQVVALNFKVLPNDNNYRLEVTQNPGLRNDSVGAAPYIKDVACVFEISNETTNNRYNLLYDVNIQYGYIKNCIDYPDTANVQNIMDYVSCPIMFTKGQVERMRNTLSSDVAKRNNWVKDTTHVRTGILDQIGGTYGIRRDLKPVPSVSVEKTSQIRDRTYFLCADGSSVFRFLNRSWRDTVTSVKFEFTNGATQSPVTQTPSGNVNNQNFSPLNTSFTEPGWVDLTLTASGNNTGDSVRVIENLVYAADPNNTINPLNGFYMEFKKDDANNNLEQWPIFNYYDNDFKWEVAENVGFYDNSCMVYRGFDSRQGTELFTGTPKGDFDDFFTPAFDLSGMGSTECRLNFMSSGVFRATDSRLMKDELEISYSTDCGNNWVVLKTLTKAELANKGTLGIPYSPLWTGDWKLQSMDIPNSARQSKVFFRFRYRPGVDDVNTSASRILPGTGNNFYIDRINISAFKLGVNTLLTDNKNIALAPNPTNGSTQLIIRSAKQGLAQVNVTDVTGKVVYTINAQMTGNITNLEIPASAIAVKGIYMVHVNAGGETFTEKLVSY